jgi:putative ABC transport system permease protein
VWRATLKGLLAHKLRLALTALSIMLGVGFVAGTYVLTDTMNKTFTDLFEQTSAGVDVYVHGETAFEDSSSGINPPIDEGIVDTVREVPGVAKAEGSVQTFFAQFVDKAGEAITPLGPPTLGFSWSTDDELNPMDIRDGRPPSGPQDVVMDAKTAEDNGFAVGDEVQVLFPTGQGRFTVSGIATFGESDNLAGATVALFEFETAQRAFDAEGKVHDIVVAGDGQVSPELLAQRIASALPPDVVAVTAEAQNEEDASALQEALGFFNTFLLVFAGVALFVGAFIIFNTFNILVTQRTRELALLRAVGASGGQVMRAVLLEATIVGLVAAVAGIGFGVLIAMLLQAVLGAIGIDLPSSGIVIEPRTVVVAVISGLVVTLASAIFPARRAARIAPVTALRETAVDQLAGIGRRAVIGGALTAAGLGLLLYALFAEVSNAISYVGLGVALIFIGVAALAPAFTRPVVGWISAPIRRLARGVPSKLARENALRNPKRSASTAAALMIGIALVATFSVMGSSFKASTTRAIEETYKADFIVSATNAQTGGGFSTAVADELRQREEIGVVSQSRFAIFREAGKDANLFVQGFDHETMPDVLNVEMVEGQIAGLGPDEILISDDAARDRSAHVGDEFRANFAASGAQTLRIAGIYQLNQVLTQYTLSLEAFEQNFPEQLDFYVYVTGAEGVPLDQVRSAVEEAAAPFPNAQVQDQAELRETFAQQIDQILGLIYVLLAFAVIIALMGIVNTLALSVYERTRELGLLRALGLGRKQTKRMVRWESVMIALFGGLLGLVLGVVFGWSLVTSLRDEGVEVVQVPFASLLTFLVAAGLAGVLAAIGPARRAAKLDVLQAIAHE